MFLQVQHDYFTYECSIRLASQRFTVTTQNAQHLKNVASGLLSKTKGRTISDPAL
jgi:hypothetical protein